MAEWSLSHNTKRDGHDNDGSRDIYDNRHDDGHADAHLHLPGDADGNADHGDAAADHACADSDADRSGGRADASGGDRLPSSNGQTCGGSAGSCAEPLPWPSFR